MKKIGRLKTYTSKEIENSYVSIGFECLDRDLFNPEKCYDLLAESGVKYARCQTGWAKCEKENLLGADFPHFGAMCRRKRPARK